VCVCVCVCKSVCAVCTWHKMTHAAAPHAWRHNSNDVILQHKQQRWHLLLLLLLPFPLLRSDLSLLPSLSLYIPLMVSCCHGRCVRNLLEISVSGFSKNQAKPTLNFYRKLGFRGLVFRKSNHRFLHFLCQVKMVSLGLVSKHYNWRLVTVWPLQQKYTK